MNKDIQDNVSRIIEDRIPWNEAIEIFDLHDGNLQAVYVRYIYCMSDYVTLLNILNDDSYVVQDKK